MAKLFASAAYRIAIVYSIAFALTIVALGAAIYVVADANIRHQQDAGLADEARDLTKEFQREGLDDMRQAISAREIGSATNSYGYALFDLAGHRVAGALDIARPAPGWHDIMIPRPAEMQDPARMLVTEMPRGLRLAIALDTDALENIDRTILMLCMAAIGLAVVIGTAGAFLLAGYLRHRLDHISSTAQAIVLGDLGRRVPVGRNGDEFDRVGLAINAMLDRIAQLLDNLRQVSGDVAHDLRTPLARLRAHLEAALDGAPDAQLHRDALKRALGQSDDLLTLFGAILRISEVEGGDLAAGFTPVDVSALAADVGESYAPAVADGRRTIRCDIEPDIIVRGNRELIAQALINLIDNAQHHTPSDTAIVLAATGDGDWARLSVADNGPGVPSTERDNIMRRFVRLEASRSTAGHGLGLNLVSAIASAHRGTLTIEDNRPGLIATIIIPVAPA